MKQLVVSALVAAIISGVMFVWLASPDGDAPAPAAAPPAAAMTPSGLELSVTDALPEDVWVDGSRQAGDDHRILTNAETSVCFITKVQISGVSSPDDSSACTMQVDEFTGFWDLVVSVPEGSRSNVRCNARCLTWE